MMSFFIFNFLFFKMIILVFFYAAVTATPQDDLYQKLKNYQNLTGISTEEFDLLWKQRHNPGKKSLYH